jgi:hypothetical protein
MFLPAVYRTLNCQNWFKNIAKNMGQFCSVLHLLNFKGFVSSNQFSLVGKLHSTTVICTPDTQM